MPDHRDVPMSIRKEREAADAPEELEMSELDADDYDEDDFDDDDLDESDDSEELTERDRDLELVIAYVQKRLTPEEAAQVERRLEEDLAFRFLADPFLLMWSLRPRVIPHEPVTREELEEAWDKFTKKAGFIHQRRKARKRRLTILGVVVGVILTGAWFGREPLGSWYRDWRDYTAVAAVDTWVPIGEDTEARVAPGATLRVRRVAADTGADLVKLAGAAEFRVQRQRVGRTGTALRSVRVQTRAGDITTLRATFTVTALGDTTTVALHRPEVPERFGRMVLPTSIAVYGRQGEPVMLQEGQTGRVIAGAAPEIVP